MALDLVKAFQLSKQKLYLDGNPMPYVAEVKPPACKNDTETFDNTSTGGSIDIADPFRYSPDGDGEIKFEAIDGFALAAVSNASKLVSVNAALIQNTLQPQAGLFLPRPINCRMGVQFHSVDYGTFVAGKKQEVVAKFKMFSMNWEIDTVEVISYDFLAGEFNINAEDLLLKLTSILG